jgi:hypothetical protein
MKMKKVFLLSIVILMSVSVFGQSIKVTPVLKKGMKKAYTNTTAVTTMDQTITITSDQLLTITKETPQGYEMTMENANFSSDAKDENLASRLLTLGSEILKDTKVQVRLDKDGKLLDIINYEEVKNRSVATGERMVDELFKAAPEISQVLTKEAIMEQVTGALTQENLIKSLTGNTNPLALFGLTIVNGMQDKYNNNMVDLKRTWLVNGKKIFASAKSDMSKEELKAYVLSQVEKLAPQQADMIKDNIDMVLNSGLVKIDVTENANYELGDDLWIKSMETTVETDMMGQKSSTRTKIQLKN